MLVNLSDYKPVITTSINNSIGSISIINTSDNGRRVKLSKTALNSLNNPEQVQFAFSDNKLIVAEELPDNPTFFTVRKGCIYSSSLVKEMTLVFDLDFSTGHTSRSFPAENVMEQDSGKPVLFFSIL